MDMGAPVASGPAERLWVGTRNFSGSGSAVRSSSGSGSSARGAPHPGARIHDGNPTRVVGLAFQVEEAFACSSHGLGIDLEEAYYKLRCHGLPEPAPTGHVARRRGASRRRRRAPAALGEWLSL